MRLFQHKTWFLLIVILLVGSGKAVQAQTTDSTQVNELGNNPPANPVVTPTDTIIPTIVRPKVVSPQKKSLLEKLFVGGSGDLGFQSNPYYGSYFTIGASPILGYRLTKNFAVGPGILYQYYNIGGYKFHDYGAKIFGQFLIYKGIMAHAEHEIRSTQYEPGSINSNDRYTFRTSLVGGGYRQMASNRFGFDLYLLFPIVTAASNAVNTAPVFRGGIIYNLK